MRETQLYNNCLEPISIDFNMLDVKVLVERLLPDAKITLIDEKYDEYGVDPSVTIVTAGGRIELEKECSGALFSPTYCLRCTAISEDGVKPLRKWIHEKYERNITAFLVQSVNLLSQK